MSIRSVYHKDRFLSLIGDFAIWRNERFEGARAIHSKYDRAASTILKWLYLGLHDVEAVSTYQYVLPFMVSKSTKMLTILILC